jgi:uncharacterized protein involved in exopolysaccharide biosynthesis
MTDHPTPAHADDEIDLLDLLVTIAESWKLLVFVPLLAGALTATVTTFFKPIYQSTAIVRLTEEEAAVLHSAAVLDPLLEPFGYIEKANGIVEDARQALKGDLSSASDKRTKMVTISAKAASPEAAQQLNTQAIARLVNELTPKGQEKASIEQSIAIRQQAIAVTEQSFAKLLEAFLKGNLGASNAEQAITNISALVSLVLTNKQEVHSMELSLLPKGLELFVQPPTLPHKPMPRKRAMMTVVAALAAGFVLLLFVFIRKVLVKAAANPDSAAKLASIRRSLGLGH